MAGIRHRSSATPNSSSLFTETLPVPFVLPQRRIRMSKFRQKAQARTMQVIGEMLGDQQMVQEGKEEERQAEEQQTSSDRERMPARTEG
jgi:hypothetical protein